MAKKVAKKGTTISCTVEKIYGYLSPREDKVFVRVSWNGMPAKDEVRKCWTSDDGELHLGKGIDLTETEIATLKSLSDSKPKPINFSDIFASSEGIMEKRQAGYSTKDGFIVLRRKEKR